MKTIESTNFKFYKIIIPFIVIGILTTSLFFIFNKAEQKKDFINSIVNIHFAIKKAANNSTSGKIDIKTLPKTITVNNNEYLVDYKQDLISIRNFDIEELCNQEIILAGTKGVYVTGGIKIIQTKCLNNIMTIKLKYSDE